MMAKRQSWTRELAREGMRAMALGWELAVPIFGGVLLGHYLDQQFETGYTFTLGLLVAGIFVGLHNIWRFGQRFAEKHTQKKGSETRKEDAL